MPNACQIPSTQSCLVLTFAIGKENFVFDRSHEACISQWRLCMTMIKYKSYVSSEFSYIQPGNALHSQSMNGLLEASHQTAG